METWLRSRNLSQINIVYADYLSPTEISQAGRLEVSYACDQLSNDFFPINLKICQATPQQYPHSKMVCIYY